VSEKPSENKESLRLLSGLPFSANVAARPGALWRKPLGVGLACLAETEEGSAMVGKRPLSCCCSDEREICAVETEVSLE